MCESLKCKNSTKTRKPAENKAELGKPIFLDDIYTYDIDIDLTNRKLSIFQFRQGKLFRKVPLTKRQCRKLGFLVAAEKGGF